MTVISSGEFDHIEVPALAVAFVIVGVIVVAAVFLSHRQS